MVIQEAYLSDLESDEYEDFTKVGVVRKPMYGMSSKIDENIQELAPPIDLLEEFWSKKDDYSHNDAWDEVNFSERYYDYLEGKNEAIDKLVRRAKEGEDILLVCYEKKPKKCHRFLLLNYLEERM